MDHRGFWGFSDIFGDETKVRSNASATTGEFWLTGKLVGYTFVSSHLTGVKTSGLRQDRVEAKWLDSTRCSVLIGGGEKILFG